jgi:hypothetical protein
MWMPQGWHVDTNGILSQHPDPTFHDNFSRVLVTYAYSYVRIAF